jgi:hypothetical protein
LIASRGLEWNRIDLEGRVINAGSKTGPLNIPLSLQAVGALKAGVLPPERACVSDER